ncbi:MAG: hypothetical protein K2N94_16440 [Lachnospiraceae bacterium]|nr:hypothetical protein [Lachnospiraceae bacterium]
MGAKFNDSRPCTGASAIPKSVDFRAFAANVKTMALGKQESYDFDSAEWMKGKRFEAGTSKKAIEEWLDSGD